MMRETSIPEQKVVDGHVFPRVYAPASEDHTTLASLTAWLTENRLALQNTLLESGALLLRGFAVETGEDFAAVIDAGGFEPMPYLGGGSSAQCSRGSEGADLERITPERTHSLSS